MDNKGTQGYTGTLRGNVEDRHRRGGVTYTTRPEDLPWKNGRTFHDITIMMEAKRLLDLPKIVVED